MAQESGIGKLLTIALVVGGGYVLYELFFANSATTTTAAPATTSTTPSNPTTTTASTSASGPAASMSLTSAFTALQSAAAAGENNSAPSINPDQWNFYLKTVLPSLTPPDPVPLFGPRPQANITAEQYWAVMGPWLTSNSGMSGYDRALAGLGAVMMRYAR